MGVEVLKVKMSLMELILSSLTIQKIGQLIKKSRGK
jgi:hypothetical protein